MYKLTFTDSYKRDVKSSVNYIKNILQAPTAAERLKNEIKKATQKIKATPFIYPVVPDDYLALKGIRFVIVKNYMLFYVVETREIQVIRFLYGPRDWKNILENTEME
jgi:addiction module RelE/StbE family toxin